MNARWIQKLSEYSHTKNAVATARSIVGTKILCQTRYAGLPNDQLMARLRSASTPRQIMLVEAQTASAYWRWFAKNLGIQESFNSRFPRSNEPVNQLLDIGYRYLRQEIEKIFQKYDCDMSIGLFHRAQSKDARPLVYDFMELFRVDLVDRAVQIYFRRKKKLITAIGPEHSKHFIFLLKKTFDRKRYVRSFKRCETMRYIIELQALRLIKAINHGTVFEPLPYSTRHETRCH